METISMQKKEDFVFGIHPVMEAIQSGKTIDRILMQKGLRSDASKELTFMIRQHQLPVQMVPQEKLNSITRANHQGVIALLSPIEFSSIENILPGIFEQGENPFILILDSVTDVRNFGAMVRTAECAGVHAIIIPERGSARIGGDAVKTSAGALLTVPVCRSFNLQSTLELLKNSGIKVLAVTEKTNILPSKIEMDVPLALILGAEDVGISPELLTMCNGRVMLPMFGNIKSLNVSVAAGILMYEVLRKRGKW